MRKTKIAVLVSGFISLLAAHRSSEASWATVAGGCVPYYNSIQNDRYVTASQGLDIGFSATDTNSIYLVCPVNQAALPSGAAHLKITYKDPASSASASVSATLWQMTGSGTATSLCDVSSDVEGGTWGSGATASSSESCGTLSSTSVLWAFVVVDRTLTSEDVHFYAVGF